MKAYEVFAESLAANGIRDVFGLMGDGNMQYLAYFVEHGLGRFHAAVHEATGVSMADGWSRLSGEIGVASVTHGPGLTNTVTALKESVEARSRVLLLTGETMPGRARLQTFDVEQLVHPTGAGYERVHSADSVAEDLCRAITRVHSESRPVVLSFPSALLTTMTESRARVAVRPAARGMAAAGPDVETAVERIAAWRKPLVVAGMGVVRGGGRQAILDLADLLGAPVMTTLLAKGLFAGEVRELGILGGLTYGVSKEIVDEADGVIVFGASLNRFTAGHDDGLLDGKTVIQCDVDATRFGAATPIDMALLGDAEATATALRTRLQQRDDLVPWNVDVRERVRSEDPMAEYGEQDAGKGLTPAQVTATLADCLPADKNVVSDLGRFITAPWRHLDVELPGAFTHSGHFGSIGLGLGTALGVAIGAPQRPTVLTVGDGALMMGIQEIATAARLRIPLIIIVFDDGAYGAECSKLEAFGHDPGHCLVTWPDLTGVARAFGAEASSARTVDELRAAVKCALAQSDSPHLIDVHVDPTVDYTDWHLPAD
jgi:thiamine pyrophosphate-dependent acetolactate synthase large subunit-like protein